MPGKGFGLLVKAPKGSSKSRSTNTSSGSKSKKTDKGKNNVRFRPKEDNYVPINTGMDSVAEADRSVTDSTTVQTADGDGVIRIKVRSKQLMEVFRPIRLFLNIFARFPFAIHFRIDGTIYFTYMTCFQSFNALMFTLGSIISVAIFLYILCGFVGAFIGWGSKSKERELCKLTWEERGMRQAMVPLIIFFCWSASFAIGSLYSIRYGKRFEFYYNYWNRAVQVMNMDATYGLRRSANLGHVIFGLTVLAYCALFFSFKVELLQTTSAMIVNAFTRFFIADIYKGTQNAMTLKEYITRKNSNLTTPDVFDEQNLYILLKVIGFAIMMYCMYGARCFIIQFTFFCRVLRNASFIWNERFRNHLMKENPNPDDQTRVRLDMMLLTQDHLILVQLFKMTESLFCVALQWFYAFQVITVTLAMYGFALITGVMSCQKFWGLVEDHNCSETSDRLNDWGNNVELYSFERPNVDPSIRKVGDSLTYLLIFVQSFTTLFIITHAGAAAHEEAMRGWQILRRNSFMTAANVFDRNFVHSLIISFARNNPMQISAGGYFVVNKRLLIEIILATMVYFITLLQFRPGQINMTAMCNGKALDSSLIGDDT